MARKKKVIDLAIPNEEVVEPKKIKWGRIHAHLYVAQCGNKTYYIKIMDELDKKKILHTVHKISTHAWSFIPSHVIHVADNREAALRFIQKLHK